MDIPDAMYRAIKSRSAGEGLSVRHVTMMLYGDWLATPNWRLDTSALLRFLVGLPEGLAQKVNDRHSCLIESAHRIHVSKLVLSEAYFALQTHYALTKDQAIEALSSIRTIPGFVLDPPVSEVFATPRLGHVTPGFVDRMMVPIMLRLVKRPFHARSRLGGCRRPR